MQRDPHKMAGQTYDLIVVGAGINGAMAAWDATLRGLKVALLDQGDFGAATSANSLKVIHGGFRYLQSGNLARLRLSQRETAALLRIAPNLVRPMPCLLPTRGVLTRGRPALAVALAINELLGWERNRHLPPEQAMPAGRVITRQEALRLFPTGVDEDATGGALWYDGQVEDSERLTLCCVLAAVARGAQAANYLQAAGLLRAGGAVAGVRAVDLLEGNELEIRGRAVLDAAGPWASAVAAQPAPQPELARAYNLVIDRPLAEVALGLQSRTPREQDPVCGGYRFMFLAPWRGRTLAGTSYQSYAGNPGQARPAARDLRALLDELVAACPALGLSAREVSFYHHGLLPLARPGRQPAGGGLASRHQIIDHGATGGPRGLFSLVGVKYTTARAVAQQAVDVVCHSLGLAAGPCQTHNTLLPGAQRDTSHPGQALAALGNQAAQTLALHYGEKAGEVAELAARETALALPLDEGTPIMGCQVVHGVRSEMAVKLADVALRRTDLGKAGQPSPAALRVAGQLMARELGWGPERLEREVAQVREVYGVIEELHGREGAS